MSAGEVKYEGLAGARQGMKRSANEHRMESERPSPNSTNDGHRTRGVPRDS
jgi:hypothetical protein